MKVKKIKCHVYCIKFFLRISQVHVTLTETGVTLFNVGQNDAHGLKLI